jgi:DNA adenine methylase
MAELVGSLQRKAMISINGHPAIREVFSGFHVESLDITYSVGDGAKARRLAGNWPYGRGT